MKRLFPKKEMKNLWWGYYHENGSIQVKRYFDREDLVEARRSPFVVSVKGPFEAENREEAIKIMEGYGKDKS